MNSVIGALRAVLGMDSTAFEQGVGTAQKQLNALNRSFQKTAKDLDKLGSAMSIAITAPIVAAAAVVTKAAGDFEEGMNKVRAATGASADEMSKLTALAKEVGKSSGFGAKDSASAMEALAKNGLSVTQILDGATDATVKLAAANGAQLEPAANVVTDTMQQFGKTTAELPGVVNQVTGTLIASKLGFDDYRLAIGQAGGVAGKVGLSFEDFNAALAATSASFASGSDAGTSFKTFLTKLVPESDQAKDAMHALGLSFFDSKGGMVGVEEQAARLQKALKGLSDKSKIDLVTKIFGTDAMRTALALADAGAEGIKKMRAEIDKTSASAQAAVRIEGLNGALRKLTASYEALSIAIGESGLLEAATKLVTWAADLLNKLAALDPQILKLSVEIAGAAAAIGPLLVAGAAIISWLGQLAVWVGRAIPALAPIAALLTPWLAASLAVAAAAAAIFLFGDNVKYAAGGAVTLNDMLRAMVGYIQQLEGSGLIKWLTDLNTNVMPAAGGVSGLGQALKDVLNQDLSTFVSQTVKELDAVTNAFIGAYNVIIVAWGSLGPIFDEIMEKVRGAITDKIADAVEAVAGALNDLRVLLGKDPLPPLQIDRFKRRLSEDRSGRHYQRDEPDDRQRPDAGRRHVRRLQAEARPEAHGQRRPQRHDA
jgi:TP901 family phage tail tape measure protein